MTIDKIIAAVRTPFKEPLFISVDKPIGANQGEDFSTKVERLHSHRKGAKGIYFLIPGWQGTFKESKIYLLRDSIHRRGYATLEYELPTDFLSHDVQLTYDRFMTFRDLVRADMDRLKGSYDEMNIMGTSLGCVNSTMIANDRTDISKHILIVPGHCLAESLWLGHLTQILKEQMDEEGMSLPKLKMLWHHLAPENNLDLSGKIYVHLSEADAIIPYSCGNALVKAMEQKGLQPHVKVNKHRGHYGTVISYYLSPRDV
ncbi:MAG: prolyl oligopeptidase family serine peptidase [Nanoarchaeota archaeon]